MSLPDRAGISKCRGSENERKEIRFYLVVLLKDNKTTFSKSANVLTLETPLALFNIL